MITIDKEFQSLIPPLSEDEFRQLEENCVKDGIRDALITWPQPDGTEILIDGHNRWNISAKHGGIRFDTKRMEFKSREDAAIWIIDNQLGRRNLIKYDEVLLQDKRADILRQIAKQKQLSGKADHPKKSWEGSERQRHRENETDYKIAQSAGVSEDTVRKVRAIEKHATPDIKRRVREGSLSINQGFLSTRPKQDMKAQIQKAKDEHKDFLESKKDSPVINLRAASIDESNKKIIAHSLMSEIEKMLYVVETFSAKHKPGEMKGVKKVLTKEDMNYVIDRIGRSIGVLQLIRNDLLKEVKN